MTQYDQFSSDYHWLYSDRTLSCEPFLEQYGALLDAIPSDAKVLDCACGIGIQALTLARRGFSVQGTDLSPGMIARARERGREERMTLPPGGLSFTVSTWEALPRRFHHEFDVAFCVGNAIGHCRNRKDMCLSLSGIYHSLKRGGQVVIDSRNWEKVLAERVRLTILGIRIRNRIQSVPLYVWHFPSELEEGHLLIEIILIFKEAEQIYHRYYPFVYHPFRRETLCDCLREAGFTGIQSDFEREEDVYHITARKP
uniref:Methyltransferase domain-containing protein n=1 Tax=Candidatus Kentrum eta TaxID=2126337 RepID=A0A450UMU8_9GAMM|nr:MAG: Methyltransferase domain-containing protein [Candidatus Kentron sp. H]VFJ93849.1 MAG: Methyltransferase domain-containing protein [Candidatus Kentron sp. H]VFK00512.1 MAG: Methyltransferase domain-containing protein [Candidatus Kentron sp. H]